MGSGERFYNDVSLRGPVPDRLLVRLPSLRAPDPDLARRLAEVARADAVGFFADDAPGFGYAHSFEWLSALSHMEDGRHVAGALFGAWLREHGRYAPRAWAPLLAARRTEAMLAHAPLLLEGRDAPMREQVFGTLIRQVRHLSKAAKRAAPDVRLAAAAGLTTGALCLPGADDQERVGKSALASALGALAGGALPAGFARPAEAQRFAASLLCLDAAYRGRGLTPPPNLSDAINTLRLLLGALSLPEGAALAVLPGGTVGDPKLLRALRLLRRAEGAGLLARFGGVRIGAGSTAVHAASLGPASGAFCLSDGSARIVTASGVPDAGLRAVSSRMRDWADALSLPAAAATLDAPGFGDARSDREDGEEGAVASFARSDGERRHDRRLFLTKGGDALIGEDETPEAGSTYRFPLHPDLDIRPLDEGRVSVVLPSGRQWRFEAANAAVSVVEGVWCGGGAPSASRQIVVTASRPGLRWAWRRN